MRIALLGWSLAIAVAGVSWSIAAPSDDRGSTPIHLIQTAGGAGLWTQRAVVTNGVVTRVDDNGFFLQDPAGHGDPTVSDAIFVYTGLAAAARVHAGDAVRVAAHVGRYDPTSIGAPTARAVVELNGVTGVAVVGHGSVAPMPIAWPLDRPTGALQGMLVRIAGPWTVVDLHRLDEAGQLVLARGGRPETPTNRLVPGPEAQAAAMAQRRNRLSIDDGSTAIYPNPTPYLHLSDGTLLRVGDRADELVGVLDAGRDASSAYRLQPTVAPAFRAVEPRPARPPEVGGTLRIASFNVESFFTTFADGSTADGRSRQACSLGRSLARRNCRGAADATEFMRQRDKLVAALEALDADAVALMEVQNNGAVAAQTLADALNARVGAGIYAVVPGAVEGSGDDAIQVAMLYKPQRLRRVGASISDTATAYVRPPLAQTFAEAHGAMRFTLVASHFKSKRCGTPQGRDQATGADADQADLQGCWNHRRVAEASALLAFLARLQRSGGTDDVLLVGDYNAYAREDPVRLLTDTGAVDLIGRDNAFGYSYVYDGAAGRLDQALATASLAPKVTRAVEWHIDADEAPFLDHHLAHRQPACPVCAPDLYAPTPYRASDHDPLLIGLDLRRR